MEIEKVRGNVIRLILTNRTPGCGWLHTWEERIVLVKNAKKIKEKMEVNGCEETQEILIEIDNDGVIIVERIDDEDNMEEMEREITKTITKITIKDSKIKIEEHEEKII